MAPQKFASFAPEDMKEGTNLWDNVDAVITGFAFKNEAPDNYQTDSTPVFAWVDFEIVGSAPIEERRVNATYNCGGSAAENFEISEDGFKLVPKSEDAQARKDSKFGTFVMSLINEGVSKTIFQVGDFSKIVGLKGHFKRVPDKEREFSADRKKKESTFKPMTLVCTKVLALPGQAGAGSTATSTESAGASAAPGDFDLDTAATDYLKAVLASKGKAIQRSQILLLVSQAAVKDVNRAAIAKRAGEEDFLTMLNEVGIVKYDAAGKGQPVSAAA